MYDDDDGAMQGKRMVGVTGNPFRILFRHPRIYICTGPKKVGISTSTQFGGVVVCLLNTYTSPRRLQQVLVLLPSHAHTYTMELMRVKFIFPVLLLSLSLLAWPFPDVIINNMMLMPSATKNLENRTGEKTNIFPHFSLRTTFFLLA